MQMKTKRVVGTFLAIIVMAFMVKSVVAANNPDARFSGGSYDGYARGEAIAITLQLPLGTMISVM